jgi:hypothetical protein
MTLSEKFDKYDNIENTATKEIFFKKNIYPYYLFIIYKYLKLKNLKFEKDLINYVLMRLIIFQLNRKNYNVENYHCYLRMIVNNAVNDYLRKEIPYRDNIVLIDNFDF